MSDIELRPSLREHFRAIINERLPELRSYIVPRKQVSYEAPYPSPIRVISDGFIFGIRVYCSQDTLKEIIKVFTSSRKVVLLETQVYRVGEGFLGVFVLITDKEKNIWKTAGGVADLDGVELVEVLKLKKPFSRIFINSFSYPPYINGKKAMIVPVETILKIISLLPEEQLRHIAREIISQINLPTKNNLDPEVLVQLLESLGIASKTSISFINNDVIIKIKHLGNPRHCLFYKYLLEESINKSISMIKDEEMCIFNLHR